MLDIVETEVGRTLCRGCDSTKLFSALNLGNLPIANELWSTRNKSIDLFPLHLRICEDCGLGQVEDVVPPSRLFSDYRYLSSTSSSFLEHAKSYANRMIGELNFSKSDWVLEIASNDGYLLKNFVQKGIRVLGVEAAENVSKIANVVRVPTLNAFFNSTLAKKLVSEYGSPKLIVANNVLAHVPDLQDFIVGLKVLSSFDTRISIENPSLMNLLKNNQFDTIYHEHYSYLTLHSVEKISKNLGLELKDVESLDVHGGSNRYWLQLSGASEVKLEKLNSLRVKEVSDGLLDSSVWSAFAARVETSIVNLNSWLRDAHKEGRIVCGYGAAAKASTLLNAASIKANWLPVIADESKEKQYRFLPSKGIPIVSPEEMFRLSPTDIIIFPWNLSVEIARKIRTSYGSKVQIWRVVPQIELVN